jgi:hypothetical protein
MILLVDQVASPSFSADPPMASMSNAKATSSHVDDKKSNGQAPFHSITNLQQLSSAIEEISPKRSPTLVQRSLGETEASYFLPSRESGVNDM